MRMRLEGGPKGSHKPCDAVRIHRKSIDQQPKMAGQQRIPLAALLLAVLAVAVLSGVHAEEVVGRVCGPFWMHPITPSLVPHAA